MSPTLADCAKKMITPASTAAIVGAATAFILFATGASQGDTASIASQYISALAALASENATTAVTIAGGFTTAMVYTFITKPAATLYEKCCREETEIEGNQENGVFSRTPYNAI